MEDLVNNNEKSAQNTDIQLLLAEKYGIQMFRENTTEEDMFRRGYRKATKEETVRFNVLFQYAPQIAKDTYYATEFQKTFDSAVCDTYRLKLDPKFHLGESHSTVGAFKGNAYDSNNSLKTQADWLKNNSTLDLSRIPEFAALAFNVASYATGQYFLSQINRNLSVIKTDTEDIKHFLEVGRLAEVNDAIEELNEIGMRIKFIQFDSERRTQILSRLHNIRSVARKNVSFPKDKIASVKRESSDEDKGETINQRIDAIISALLEYRLLLWVFCQSKLIEIYLYNTKNVEELEMDLSELNHAINEYYDTVDNAIDWMNSYLKENQTINGESPIDSILIGGVAAATVLGGTVGTLIGMGIGKLAIGKATQKRMEKRHDHFVYAQKQVDVVSSYHDSVRQPVKNLSMYLEATRRKVEAIKIGDEVYTNLPILEDVI